MPLETLFISGPAGGGKTTVARLIAEQVLKRKIHYLRMRAAADGHSNAVIPADDGPGTLAGNGWASMHTVSYTPDRVFEILPDGLRTVRRIERRGFTLVEADTDPALRHAYPYDYRIFVMPPPADIYTVWRTPDDAAAMLRTVMQDTASFASEIFGLFDMAGLDDGVGVHHQQPDYLSRRVELVERLDITEAQIKQFLNSPIGAEITTRIQLQPDYHAVVESDVVIINTGCHEENDTLKECVHRLEKLLARIRHDARRHSLLYWGDITNDEDPTQGKLIKRLKKLFAL